MTRREKNQCRWRSYVNVKRGKIERQPCMFCGSPKATIHHLDYTVDDAFIFVCSVCHGRLHVGETKIMHAGIKQQRKKYALQHFVRK